MTVLDLSPYLIVPGDRVRARRLRRELSRHAHSSAEAKRFHDARLRMVGEGA